MNNEKQTNKKPVFWIQTDTTGKTIAIGGSSTAKQIKARGLIPTSAELNHG
jgi:hypothetical protein